MDVIYANGLFVAVARTGVGDRVMTSPDGITWTLGSTPADNNWVSLAYGSGLFVAVAATGAGDRVMTSPDGLTWTIRSSASDNNWNGVTYGAGQFVAVGATGASNQVMTSGTFTLPLHWLSVSAQLNSSGQARIMWQVEEQNVVDYKVEKSTDGLKFNSIGSVAVQGDGQHSYTFTESRELEQKAYYRIKQIDLDGRYTYSSILTLHRNGGGEVSIYPNPTTDIVTVSVSKDLLNKIAIVTDLYGKTLQTIRITNLSFTVHIEEYPAGTYLIKLDKEKTVKIIKK
jgi:hypothetical protein